MINIDLRKKIQDDINSLIESTQKRHPELYFEGSEKIWELLNEIMVECYKQGMFQAININIATCNVLIDDLKGKEEKT